MGDKKHDFSEDRETYDACKNVVISKALYGDWEQKEKKLKDIGDYVDWEFNNLIKISTLSDWGHSKLKIFKDLKKILEDK